MRSFVLRGLAKLAKAFGFVISGVAILFVISIALKNLGYVRFIGPLILSMLDNIGFAVFGPMEANEMHKALTQSSADKLSDRMVAVFGTAAIIILLWAIGDAAWHLILKRKKQTRVIGVKRLWPLILICVAVVGFNYHRWSDQMEQEKARDAYFKGFDKSMEEARKEKERMERERRDLLNQVPLHQVPLQVAPSPLMRVAPKK